MLKDSVIEVASPGIGIGRQTLVQLARRRRAGRRRRQLDLNISDCGEPGSTVVSQDPTSFMTSRLPGEGVKKCRHWGKENFGNHLESKMRLSRAGLLPLFNFNSCIWSNFSLV